VTFQSCRGVRGGGFLPPGLAAGLHAKSGVVQLGRDACGSSANVRHPPPRQVHMAWPFVLVRPPGATPAGHRPWRGGVRAFGVRCFAGKLRSPACPSGGGDPVTMAGARGFLLAKGANGPSTPISFPGAPRTIALGINDQGQVVGTYENTAAAPPSPQPTSTPPTGRMSEHRWPPDRARPELARSGARSTRPARLLPILAGKPSAG
jgi:hypothetical protein